MHERLKFKIQLNDQRGNDPEWGHQPVFTEARYGTHFVINARFEGKEAEKGTIKLDNIHFYIQSYTGAVTVGLEKFSLVEECNLQEERYRLLLEPNYPDSRIYKITLFAQGFNNNLQHTHKIKETLTEINPGDILVTEVIYLPVTKRLTNWDNETMYKQALYLDPIYMERDGEDVNLTKAGKLTLKKLKSLGIVETDDGEFDFRSITSFEVTGGVGDDRECKASVSMLI